MQLYLLNGKTSLRWLRRPGYEEVRRCRDFQGTAARGRTCCRSLRPRRAEARGGRGCRAARGRLRVGRGHGFRRLRHRLKIDTCSKS